VNPAWAHSSSILQPGCWLWIPQLASAGSLEPLVGMPWKGSSLTCHVLHNHTLPVILIMSMDTDPRNSSSHDTGFGRYDTYNVPGLPSDIPLPLLPLLLAQQPQYVTPTIPTFERGLVSIRRSHPEPFLRPRVPQDQYDDDEMTFLEDGEFPEDESPEPLLSTDPMGNASDFVKKLFNLTLTLGPLRIPCFNQ